MPGIKNQVEIRIFSRRTVRLCSRHKKRRHKDAFFIKYGRGRGIRTPDILLPKQARYRTALYPGMCNEKPLHIDIMRQQNYCLPQTAACRSSRYCSTPPYLTHIRFENGGSCGIRTYDQLVKRQLVLVLHSPGSCSLHIAVSVASQPLMNPH